jgi:Mn2+/Fe2+ NRAMP family transporter
LVDHTFFQNAQSEPDQEEMNQLEVTGVAQDQQGHVGKLVVEKGLPLEERAPRSKLHQLLRLLGPGFLSGMAGNDATAMTTYAIDGARAGYGHLWLLLLSTPMYQAVQFACAKIGRITQKGLADILREYYGRWVALLAVLILVIANVALIAGDLAAIGSGLELITGLSSAWFVIPVAVLLWCLTVYRSFESITKIFIILSLAFVTYLITALFADPNWGVVLLHTFVPQVSFDFSSLSAAVALLGATISPYSMFWQAHGEKEQPRAGSLTRQMRSAAFDVASGVISGNLVVYFVIVTTAATLFTHHQSINTAADAAQALEPLLGPFAKYLFAIGLIGAGFIALPVLLASTSYAVAGAFGWPSGLSQKLSQCKEFYLILTGTLIVGLVVALLPFNPIQLIFYANVLVGVLAPMLVIYVMVVGNNRTIMQNEPLGLVTNLFLVVTVIVLVAADLLFFYGLLT